MGDPRQKILQVQKGQEFSLYDVQKKTIWLSTSVKLSLKLRDYENKRKTTSRHSGQGAQRPRAGIQKTNST
jgi:hypothetical protein